MIPSVQELAGQLSRLVPPGPGPTESQPGAEPAPAPAAPVLPRPPHGVQAVDYAVKGYHLEAQLPPDQVVAAASLLDQGGFALDTITGVDWLAAGEMEVVYDYFHPRVTLRVAIRCRIPRADPVVPTISPVFPGANWHERETHDFFGIRFAGHPNLTPFLLPEDADYHPLRKDFAA